MIRQFDFVDEPRDNVLDLLLDVALESCDEFVLALSRMELRPSGRATLDELSSFRLECEQVAYYPAGLMLEEDAVTVCRYRLSAPSVGVLKRSTRHLYGWQEPDLPNDLCILRSGRPWLVTNAADEGASLYLDDREARDLRSRIPDLFMTLSKESGRLAND